MDLQQSPQPNIPFVPSPNVHPIGSVQVRLAREFLSGVYRPGQTVEIREIAAKYELDDETVFKTFTQLQTIGVVALSGTFSALVRSPNSKEMHEAYEIRAALEEIAGRTAALSLKHNTASLQRALDAMRLAVFNLDLDAYAENDVIFHRTILESSQNGVLLQVWETLAFDLRIRAAIGKVTKNLPDVVESHQPIIDALEKGRGREAGVLLRNHVETFLEYLKKSESDSGDYRALRRDLQGAKAVQRSFFPSRSFSIPCLSCETFYQPAHEIGGDYYDLLSLHDSRWGIAIGDVSGKGIGAALVMASLQASLRAHALHPHLDPSTLICDVNRLVHESSPSDFYASLFYAEYEPAKRVLRYVNAGHNPPLVLRPQNGSCEIFRLTVGGMPIGISAEQEFPSATFQFEIGDVLVAYTDGITEAENRRHELWGVAQLEELLSTCSHQPSDEIINSILEAVSQFADGQPQRDDVTLVVMRVQPGCDF